MIVNHIPQHCCTRPRHLQTLLRGMIILLSCLKNAHGQDEVAPNTAGQSPVKSTTTATEKPRPTFAELKAEIESLENYADRQDFVEKKTFSFSSERFEQSLGFPLKGKARVLIEEFRHIADKRSLVVRSYAIDGKTLDPNSEAAREDLKSFSGQDIPLTHVGTFPPLLMNGEASRLSVLMKDPSRVSLSWQKNNPVLLILSDDESRRVTGELHLQADEDGRWIPVQFDGSPTSDAIVHWKILNLEGNRWYDPYYLPKGTLDTVYRNKTMNDDVLTSTFEVLFRSTEEASKVTIKTETPRTDPNLPTDMLPRDQIGSTDESLPSKTAAARIVELESKIADLESHPDHDDALLFDLKAELGRLKDATEAGDALGNYESEKLIPELKASLAILLAELGPKHPRVAAIERQIAALELAAKLDQTSVTVFYLKHANAKETSEKIEQLYPEREAQVVVDERNNSLLIRGDEATIHKYEQLLEVLDADDLSSPQQAKLPDGTSSFGGGGFGGVRGAPGAAGSSSTPAQSTTNNSVSPEEVPNDDTEQLKIFSLKFSNANDTLKIVQSLFGLPSVKVAADERTNSLIVSGDASSLSEIEAILLKLDSGEPAASPSNPLAARNGGNAIAAPTPIAESRQRLDALEQPVQQLAEQVRATEAKLGKDHADSAKLRVELRALVQETFAARQEIQRAELAEFTRRLQRMQQSIETREKIAEKIVDRRVEELLNSDASWEQSPRSSRPANEINSVNGGLPEKYHGDWIVEQLTVKGGDVDLSAIRNPSLKISADHFVIPLDGNIRETLAYTLLPGTPTKVDLIIEPTGSKALALGIVEITDDTFKLCFREPADAHEPPLIESDRPRTFGPESKMYFVQCRRRTDSSRDERVVSTTVGGGEISYIPWKAPKNARKLEISPTAWGESINGLRVALAVTDGPEEKPGMRRLHLVINNVSKELIPLDNVGWADDFTMAMHVRRNSGEQVETRRPKQDRFFDPSTGAYSLEPGETVVLATKLIGLGLADESNSEDIADLWIVDQRSKINPDGHRTWYIVGSSIIVPGIPGHETEFRLHTGSTALEFGDRGAEQNSGTDKNTSSSPPKSDVKETHGIVFESAAAADQTSPPESDAETAIARMVLVFFQDEARRAVPGLMIDHGTETLVLTTGPATIVPDGVGHAIDRAFLEIPGESDLAATFIDTKTADVRVHRAEQGLTNFQLNEPVDLAIGDSLSAIIVSGQPNLRVTPNVARISALDQATMFSHATHKFLHQFSGLVQINQRLPEGTPLFKDGQLAGITLLGTRFMKDDVPGSYVVPASRIVEVLKSMKTE
jgi:hypothetical protein